MSLRVRGNATGQPKQDKRFSRSEAGQINW